MSRRVAARHRVALGVGVAVECRGVGRVAQQRVAAAERAHGGVVPAGAQVLEPSLGRGLLGVVAVVGPLEPIAVAGQRLRGQLLLAPRGVGEAGGDFCGISRFREYRISGARGGQGRTRHKQCAESRRTSRPNLASFSRVSTRRDRAQRHLGRNL